MSVDMTFKINKLKSSKTLPLLLVGFFTFSIMSMSACSDNDNNSTSQRIVQATVYFDDEGPAATAWVQDGDQNFVSDAILSINGRPFEVITLGDEESDEGNIPIYYLELYDLKGGDSLTLVAKRSDGRLIYGPPSAQIPMPLELVEPEPDQVVIPGEEVVVRWAGGEGSTHIAAFYAQDSREEEPYIEAGKFGELEFITLPQGVIRAGGGIIGVVAVSGSDLVFQEEKETGTLRSEFTVPRTVGIHIQPEGALQALGALGACPAGQKVGGAGHCCTYSPSTGTTMVLACVAEHVAIVGIAVWGTRLAIDKANYKPCNIPGIQTPLNYCNQYSQYWSHYSWGRGCICPR